MGLKHRIAGWLLPELKNLTYTSYRGPLGTNPLNCCFLTGCGLVHAFNVIDGFPLSMAPKLRSA